MVARSEVRYMPRPKYSKIAQKLKGKKKGTITSSTSQSPRGKTQSSSTSRPPR